MLLRTLTLCLLLSTAACSKAPEPAAAAVPAASAPTPAAAEPATAAAAPKEAEKPAATAPISPPPSAVTQGLQPGDYDTIEGGKPYGAVVPGQVEVVEFFNYACPACNAFEPLMQAWKAKLPAAVQVVYVPADFRADFEVYARVYYAADLLGIAGKTHAAVYQAIHDSHKLPGEGRLPDTTVIAAFYAQQGVTAQAFTDAMNSFAVNTRMNQGHQYMVQSKLASTPSLLVNGRYMAKGQTFEDKLRIASLLIERELGQGAAQK